MTDRPGRISPLLPVLLLPSLLLLGGLFSGFIGLRQNPIGKKGCVVEEIGAGILLAAAAVAATIAAPINADTITTSHAWGILPRALSSRSCCTD